MAHLRTGFLRMHYAIEDATIGVTTCAIFAFRCATCEKDFHIDHKPEFCPTCGVKFIGELPWN